MNAVGADNSIIYSTILQDTVSLVFLLFTSVLDWFMVDFPFFIFTTEYSV